MADTTIAKPIWQSKTFWLNVIGVVVIILQTVLGADLPISPEIQATILGILNILNRFQTQDRVTLT